METKADFRICGRCLAEIPRKEYEAHCVHVHGAVILRASPAEPAKAKSEGGVTTETINKFLSKLLDDLDKSNNEPDVVWASKQQALVYAKEAGSDKAIEELSKLPDNAYIDLVQFCKNIK